MCTCVYKCAFMCVRACTYGRMSISYSASLCAHQIIIVPLSLIISSILSRFLTSFPLLLFNRSLHFYYTYLICLSQVCGIEGEGEDKQQRSQTVRSSATPVFNRKWVSSMLSSRSSPSLYAGTILTFDSIMLRVFTYVCMYVCVCVSVSLLCV